MASPKLAAIACAITGLMLAQPVAAQTLSCGQVAVGTISAPGERDQFTFFGEQGDVVTFTMVEAGDIDTGFLVSGAVYRPTEMPGFTFRTLIAGTQNVTQLPETGMYTVHLFDFIGNSRGSYAFRIGWLLPIGKQCGDRTAHGCGQVAAGAIATPLEHDIFTFFGQQGQTVRLTLTQTGGFVQGLPFGERLSPSGGYLGTITTSFPTTFPLSETGTYVVAIHDNINRGVSSYTLRLEADTPCQVVPPPGSPANLLASVTGSSVTLTWSAPTTGGPVTSYQLEAGSAPGASNLAIFDTGSGATAMGVNGVPPGTYFVRIKAKNSSGISTTSNEIVVIVN